ncbi:MAG: histidinol dehydrogenase [Bdellovibrionales bacterium]
MMEIKKWNGDATLLARAPMVQDTASLTQSVQKVLNDVRLRGDEAVREYTARFDGVNLKNCHVSEKDAQTALSSLSPDLRTSLEIAKKNISAFHKAQMPAPVAMETMSGVRCEMQWRPVEKIGLYVPGGTAPLFSTVLMLAVPAMLAGCRQIVLCAPPQKDGKINPETLAASTLCGVTEIFAIGGAQAIAAMAYGTETVPKVDKIFGPGNAYVTMAKQLVAQDSNGAAIDMPAGPSEVMVIANEGARAEWVAADLLAQAEHDTLSQAILLTNNKNFAETVRQETVSQMKSLSRCEIIKKSLAHSRIILAENEDEIIDIVNFYAPEHLIIHGKNAENFVPNIRTAGSVFVGDFTPETAGDYASGTNHVLPTYGAARAYSGLSLYSFLRSMTVQTLSNEGLQKLAPSLTTMAEAEGLDAHARAVKIRFQEKGKKV